jgi:hypothetical protein
MRHLLASRRRRLRVAAEGVWTGPEVVPRDASPFALSLASEPLRAPVRITVSVALHSHFRCCCYDYYSIYQSQL